MDTPTAETGKFIIFDVADYWFLLPVTAILRIVNCPPATQGGTVGIGLVQLGSHTIRLVNLYQEVGHVSAPDYAPFLVVVRNPQKELWGIALEQPPDLIELPLTIFKPVALETPFDHKTNWISHMAIVSEKESDRTLLLLDVHAVFQHSIGQPLSA
ncbi:chemotaxis signal transduction protein [Leptolyngbya sp. Heron Island J]|uniref:chemotaxis protein CheW n=1 Tax=Leptolyngbya sp. Heron Island J TaxID=1385935 RepID=UPI0003B994D6|nr:chemotaxis protein CheW [Leptolyngbya sp. Heron Island J]ESA32712.1 chemotaxis signal transduction protein [Leptolyngbya sp. Heron Island J]